MKLSQTDRILQALKENPDGLHPTYFIVTLHIYQYSARLHELRERFNCQCKNGYEFCNATEHIRNYDLKDGTTLFKYVVDNRINWEKMRQETIKEQQQTPTQNSLF